MRKTVPILIVAVSALAVVIAIAAFALFRAAHAAPEFYERALAEDPAVYAKASDEFLQQALALASDVEHRDRWQIVFSERQINGWLAVDVPHNLPEVIPPEVNEPRVQILPEELTVACRLKTEQIDAVVSLSANIFASGPNEVAIRIRGAHVGSLRAPLAQVLEPLSRALEGLNLQTVWRQQEGDPVLVIKLGAASDDNRHGAQLDTIELGNGELLIAGSRGGRAPEPVVQDDEEPAAVSASATKTKLQR